MTWFLIRATKVAKMLTRILYGLISTIATRIVFAINGIQYGRKLRALGVPSVNVSLGGDVSIGNSVTIRNGLGSTEVGLVGSRIRVGPKGCLRIGNFVGMSNVTIVCDNSIVIGNHVCIGGGVQIFDTNFHSLDAAIRAKGKDPMNAVRTAPVCIGNDVFIGTNAIICKGVTIGEKAIIAAGSIVVRSIPPGEVWGGNPATKIR